MVPLKEAEIVKSFENMNIFDTGHLHAEYIYEDDFSVENVHNF